MKSMIRIAAAVLSCLAFAGCEVLAYTPLRDNPNDSGATVAAAPVFDPPGGAYGSAQSVSISTATYGATIRYTLDGSPPTSVSGSLYIAPVPISGTTTLMAVSYRGGLSDSAVSSATYTIQIASETPQGLSVGSATSSSLTISWSRSPAATSYQLYRDASEAGTFSASVYDGASLVHTDTGLAPASTYYYKVRATNAYGSSALSAAVLGTTTLSGNAPSTPTGLIVGGPTPSSLSIGWNASAGASTNWLYRDTSASGSFSLKVYDGPALAFTDTGLAAETTYYYKVQAISANGWSASSPAAFGATDAATTPPDPLSGLTLSFATSSTISISWTASTGATSYRVYRDTSPSGLFDTQVYDGGLLQCTDSGLGPLTTYYYRAQASNSSGPSAPTATAAFATTLLDMIPVAGGTYEMGDAAGDADELPVHSVTVSNFVVGQHEVTQAQYLSVIGSNPSYFTADTQRPVERVRWYDAVAFCNALSTLEGRDPCYTIDGTTVAADWSRNGYRLPTEAEWEYAARGGTASHGYTCSESDTAEDVAWYSSNSGGTTHSVGARAANELGICDMSGNVWEWCWDWYGPYSSSPQTDPTGPASGAGRVRRGGSWGGGVFDMRCAVRRFEAPDVVGYTYGFRVVRRAD